MESILSVERPRKDAKDNDECYRSLYFRSSIIYVVKNVIPGLALCKSTHAELRHAREKRWDT